MHHDAEHSREVVEERELDEGRGAAGKQVAAEVHEREDGPAVQQEDEHRVQEVVVVHQHVRPVVPEHSLGRRQTEGQGEGCCATGGQARAPRRPQPCPRQPWSCSLRPSVDSLKTKKP